MDMPYRLAGHLHLGLGLWAKLGKWLARRVLQPVLRVPLGSGLVRVRVGVGVRVSNLS